MRKLRNRVQKDPIASLDHAFQRLVLVNSQKTYWTFILSLLQKGRNQIRNVKLFVGFSRDHDEAGVEDADVEVIGMQVCQLRK